MTPFVPMGLIIGNWNFLIEWLNFRGQRNNTKVRTFFKIYVLERRHIIFVPATLTQYCLRKNYLKCTMYSFSGAQFFSGERTKISCCVLTNCQILNLIFLYIYGTVCLCIFRHFYKRILHVSNQWRDKNHCQISV